MITADYHNDDNDYNINVIMMLIMIGLMCKATMMIL